MTLTAPTRRLSVATRRVGMLSPRCEATLLYLVNVWPGWQEVPFLTANTRQVLDLVNLSLTVAWSWLVRLLGGGGPSSGSLIGIAVRVVWLDLGEDARISLVVRDSQLIPV